MTLKTIAKTLIERGYDVNYYVRPDGSIRIREIDGQRYEGSRGNEVARALAGQTLSPKKVAQTSAARAKIAHMNVAPLAPNVVREIRRAQRALHEASPMKGVDARRAKASTAQVRASIEKYGEAKTLEDLKAMRAWAKGYVYPDRIKSTIGVQGFAYELGIAEMIADMDVMNEYYTLIAPFENGEIPMFEEDFDDLLLIKYDITSFVERNAADADSADIANSELPSLLMSFIYTLKNATAKARGRTL